MSEWDVDDLEDQEDEIMRRWFRGEGSTKISADMCIPVLKVREVLHRAGQDTARPPKRDDLPAKPAAPVRPAPVKTVTPVKVYEPAPQLAAAKDLRVETLLADGDKSKRDRTRRLADRVRTELDTLRVLLAEEAREQMLRVRLQVAERELAAAREAMRASKTKS